MSSIIKAETRIDTETGPIPVRDFSYFLYLFRAVYVAAIQVYEKNHFNENLTEDNVKKLSDIVKKIILRKSTSHLSHLFFYKLPISKDLTILDIKRENPLDVIFSGIPIALAVAVIFSGGKLELTKIGMKVELPPLGEGIRSLINAFDLDVRQNNSNSNKQSGSKPSSSGPKFN